MRRIFSLPVLIFTLLTALTYAYAAMRLADGVASHLALALPFLLVWMVPIIYWFGEREGERPWDWLIHVGSYLAMGWLSFLLILLVLRDALTLLATWTGAVGLSALLNEQGATFVLGFSGVALVAGALRAYRGPCLHEVEVWIDGLPETLDGYRIAQITDLHVGPTIRRGYVERVVEQTNALAPDLIALTGDMVDGSVAELAPHVAPLAGLRAKGGVFLALGNHDYYSGEPAWTAHFEKLGIRVLRNAHALVAHGAARLLVGGVVDPAVRLVDRNQRPDPEQARGPREARYDFHLLLAHNPKLAREGAKAGFDLQLSGHTHAGQFIPWTIITRWVHAPHYAGLSREGSMWVYVSAGTGTWGPPLRVGTTPELTLIKLRRKS